METEPNNEPMSWGDAIHQLSSAPDSNPLCVEYVPDPVKEAEWFAAQSRINAARTVELMDRAKACAEALTKDWNIIGFDGLGDDRECFSVPSEEIAAVIFPFLNPQP